jgi:hypothetical protein
MTGQDRTPGGIDTSTPNVARIYDFLLGGKDNLLGRMVGQSTGVSPLAVTR